MGTRGRRALGVLLGLRLAAGGFVSVAAGQETPGEARLTVRVLSESGAPLWGARITVWRRGGDSQSPWAEVASRSIEGRVIAIDLPEEDRYRIAVTARGHEARIDTVVARRSTAVTLVLRLDPYLLPTIVAGGDGAAVLPAVRTLDRVNFEDESMAYATVAEWLANVPGVSLQGRGAGSRQYLSVRGSRPEDVLVLLDGVPLNDPLTGRADLSHIPTATLESATLVRGTASRAYGPGATAGALLLTSRAVAGTGVGGGVRVESFGGLGIDVQADAGGPAVRFGASVSVDQSDNDFPYRNPLDGDASPQLRTNADARGAHVALRAGTGPLRATFRLDDSEHGLPGRAGTRLFDSARAEDRSWIGSAGIEGARGRASATYARRLLSYLPSASGNLSSQEVRELRTSADAVLPGTPVRLGARLSSTRVAGDGLDGGGRGLWSAGATASAVVSTGSVRVDPGLAVDVDRGRAVLSPEVGVSWQPSGLARLWGRLGRGFRGPTFGDLYFQSLHRLTANPDLLPERIVLDAELGFSGTALFGGFSGTASLAGWLRTTEDPIVWVASSAAVWSPRNLESLRARGIDLRLGLESRGAGGWGFRTALAGTLQDSRVGFGSNRNPLPYQPGASAEVSLGAWRGSSGVGLHLHFTGRRITTLAATRSLGAFLTADVSAYQRFSTGLLHFGLYAKVENVWNQEYELTELFPEPGRRFSVRLEARGFRP